MNEIQDDTIDLFKVFQTVWDGKFIISVFSFLALLLGGGFLLTKDDVYESKLAYSINTLPPYYENTKASVDLQKMFFSKDIFDDWKSNNGKASLSYEDLNRTEFINGFIIAKDKNSLKITFEVADEKHYFILVKSNKLSLLNDIYQYADHVNDLLKSKYKIEAINALSIIKNELGGLSATNNKQQNEQSPEDKINYLTIQLFLTQIEKGTPLFVITHPTMPTKVYPRSFFILIVSVILGAIIGTIFIFFRKAMRDYKVNLTNV